MAGYNFEAAQKSEMEKILSIEKLWAGQPETFPIFFEENGELFPRIGEAQKKVAKTLVELPHARKYSIAQMGNAMEEEDDLEPYLPFPLGYIKKGKKQLKKGIC